jgi:PAS domain S-box-containing protein
MSIENKKTILLVEDEAIIAVVQKMALEKYGYNIITANSGEMALGLFKDNSAIDLVLMDIDLGDGIDGTETAGVMLDFRDVPLVFLSSHTEPAVVEKTGNISSYGYVVKNSGITVLDASIKMAFKLFYAHDKLQSQKMEMEALYEEVEASNEELEALNEELIKTGEEMMESEERFKALHNASFGGITIHDKGIILECNQGLSDITGYSYDELIGMNGLLLISEKTRQMVMDNISAGYEKPYEAIGLRKNGEEYPIRLEARNVPYKGKMVRTVEFRDITDSKLMDDEIKTKNDQLKTTLEEMEAANEELTAAMEELDAVNEELIANTEDLQTKELALRESEKKFKAIIDTVPLAIHLTVGQEQVTKYVNPTMVKLFGYTMDDIPSVSEWWPLAYPDEEYRRQISEEWNEKVRHAIETQTPIEPMEVVVNCKDGSKKNISWGYVTLGDQNYSCGLDLTGWKKTEEELQKSRRRFEQMIKNSSDSISILDAEGNQIYVSDAVERILGYKPEELTNIPVIKDMIHPDDQQKTLDTFMEILSKGQGRAEYRHKHKNGSWVYLEGWGTNQLNNPDILGVVVNVRDVTARKIFEDEIKLDEARLESLLSINQHSTENIQDLLDFTLAEAIKLTESKIGYIYLYDEDKEEFALNTWSKEVMAQCAVVEKKTIYQLSKTGLWGEAVRQRQPIMVNDYEASNIYKRGLPEGHNFLKRYLTIPVISNERIVAVVGVANKETDYNESDIRQLNLMMDAVWMIVLRKQAEDEILKLLSEKEIILKEVHHRIKNNMNTISNLLRIQAEDQENPEIKKVMFDAEGRVLSMMVLYDKLYRSADFEKMPIAEYLPALVDEILANFPERMTVKIEKQIDDFILDVNILQPLGIIINELLTNTMKYAFKGRKDCLITISAKLSGRNISIIIQDNGKGLPESFDPDKPGGFGMQLVSILTEQIGGHIRIERGEGTKFVLEFDAV